MHITILADPVDNQRAGVHFYTKNLIKHLLKNDRKNQYTLIHRRENPFFEGTNHIIIPKKNRRLYETYRKLHLIPKKIKELKPDLVFEPSHIGPLNMPPDIKRATMIYDITPILFPQFHTKRSTRTHRLLLPRIIRNANLILTPSENTKKDVQSHYQTNAQITSIGAAAVTNPIDASRPLQNPYILYLGTIEPRKNLETLIDAFLEIKESLPDYKLVLAGGVGWKVDHIIKKAHHPDIIITEYLTENQKQAYLSHAELFVYPSIYEGFGLPPLEAMHHGIPVICSTGGSLKEIYQDKALMFEPKDKETLKKHMLELSLNKHLHYTLSRQGREHAGLFTWDKVAQKCITAFNNL